MATLSRVRAQLTALSPLVLLVGLCAVALLNLRRWHSDVRRAQVQPVSTRPTPTHQPPVSVLVAAWNESEKIEHHIQSFLALAYPRKQLVLCAGGTDGTFALANNFSATEHVIVLEQHAGEGKQRALSRCFNECFGEIIFLTDADCLLDNASFDATLAPLLNDGEVVSTGASHPLKSQKSKPFVLQQWLADVYVRSHWGEYTTGLLGRNMALTRKALQQAGAFEANVRTGTDYHMAQELIAHGYKIRVAPGSSVATHYADALADYRKQQARWLRNVVLHSVDYGDWQAVGRSLTPSFLGFGMILMPFTAFVLGPISLALWLVVFIHAVASRVRYCRFGSLVTGQPFIYPLLLPVYVLTDFGVWAAVLPEYLLERLRSRW
ncbi:MAG TPA: glycosyltransferase family 2 protein [Candidatus Limnocylindrales bacterium]|nr:glycosyltransferase family 2 protein [Candidatus Limnocylindrales bacterium]